LSVFYPMKPSQACYFNAGRQADISKKASG
jgi:hypothetical protein